MIGLRAICGSICRARFRTKNEIDAHSAIFPPRFVQRVRNREDVTPADKNNGPLDAILRRATPTQPGPATPECADAESLAAYSDRSLAAAERDRLETHFADCMRCQLLLADIARADQSARDARGGSGSPVVSKMAHRNSRARRSRRRSRFHRDKTSCERGTAAAIKSSRWRRMKLRAWNSPNGRKRRLCPPLLRRRRRQRQHLMKKLQ